MIRRLMGNPVVALSVVLLCFVLFASFAYIKMGKQRSFAQSTAGKVDECSILVSQIKALRQRQSFAAPHAQRSDLLSQKIDQLSVDLGIGEQCVSRIEPQPRRRMNDSVYEQQSTLVELRGVTLRQLVSLATAITESTELKVSSIQLNAPHHDLVPDVESWDAELTLTYLIFSPKSLSVNN